MNVLEALLGLGVSGVQGYRQQQDTNFERRRQKSLDAERAAEILYRHQQDAQQRADAEKARKMAIVQGFAGHYADPSRALPALLEAEHGGDPFAPTQHTNVSPHLPSLGVTAPSPQISGPAPAPTFPGGAFAPPTVRTEASTALQDLFRGQPTALQSQRDYDEHKFDRQQAAQTAKEERAQRNKMLYLAAGNAARHGDVVARLKLQRWNTFINQGIPPDEWDQYPDPDTGTEPAAPTAPPATGTAASEPSPTPEYQGFQYRSSNFNAEPGVPTTTPPPETPANTVPVATTPPATPRKRTPTKAEIQKQNLESSMKTRERNASTGERRADIYAQSVDQQGTNLTDLERHRKVEEGLHRQDANTRSATLEFMKGIQSGHLSVAKGNLALRKWEASMEANFKQAQLGINTYKANLDALGVEDPELKTIQEDLKRLKTARTDLVNKGVTGNATDDGLREIKNLDQAIADNTAKIAAKLKKQRESLPKLTVPNITGSNPTKTGLPNASGAGRMPGQSAQFQEDLDTLRQQVRDAQKGRALTPAQEDATLRAVMKKHKITSNP